MVRRPAIVGNTWFNLPAGKVALTEEDLSKKIVLIDFWTYSCINCVRTLPYIAEWNKKYKDRGLIIIGIHTPEFEFEKDPVKVEAAIKRLGVMWPVVLDNDQDNWSAFANKYWPAKYLCDQNGYIVYHHFGEGGYTETEKFIQSLLKNTGATRLPEVDLDDHAHGEVCFIPTPELYFGLSRGFLASPQEYQDKLAKYEPPKEMIEDGIALSGEFTADKQYVHIEKVGASIFLRFHATEVNLVMEGIPAAQLEVYYNTLAVTDEMKGADVTAASEVGVSDARMYNLIRSNDPLEGILEVRLAEGAARVYSATFSGCTASS